jgi:hypothetical protein
MTASAYLRGVASGTRAGLSVCDGNRRSPLPAWPAPFSCDMGLSCAGVALLMERKTYRRKDRAT